MRIAEDKTDRDRMIRRLSAQMFQVRPKQYDPVPKVGWPRKHQLWPCVRLGAGQVFLQSDGEANPSMRRVFNFLRGHSHEALLTRGQQIVIVYDGVANEMDEWTGEDIAPFTEVKSTTVSSARMLPIVQKGSVPLLDPLDTTYFRFYFEQCGQNCVAAGVDHCRLRVFFMNGEYADRRKKCPSCQQPLSDMVSDMYRPCRHCGYKCYAVDLRSYILSFSQEELAYYRREVFQKRRDQFNDAIQAETKAQVLERAPGTKTFICRSCHVGEELGCEFAEVSR